MSMKFRITSILKNRVLFSFCTLILLSTLVIESCSHKFVRNKEARDDQTEMEMAVSANKLITNVVFASIETEPVYSPNINDDTADDPAIWYNDEIPSKSVIFGSNKMYGIHSYNLMGEELQYIPAGTINNIDVRKNIKLGKKTVDVLVGSHRLNNTVDIYIIDSKGSIGKQADHQLPIDNFDPYGFCLFKNNKQKLFALVNNKQGIVYQMSIDLNNEGKLMSTKVNEFKLDTQVEGMVVDDENAVLYVGEEQNAIFKFELQAENNIASRGKMLKDSEDSNVNIRYDIEGLALLNSTYLLASSQGNFSYAVFDLKRDKYVTSFKIGDNTFDAVEETDGIEINTNNFGPDYPKGIMVVQDGFNFDGDIKKAQNFKIVDLRDVMNLLD